MISNREPLLSTSAPGMNGLVIRLCRSRSAGGMSLESRQQKLTQHEGAMPTFYFPKLTADNYQTFRRLTKIQHA
jgi:hypothetical protein